MRIQKLIAAFLLLAQMSFAQTSWFTHHPVWTNNYIGGWIGAGTSTYSIGTDTIINGHQAVNIQRDYVYNLGGGYTSSRPVQQSGDTIFVFKESGQRSVLYNFSQSVGDTVQMATVWGGTQSFMITATGTQVIDGVSLRFQEWEQIEQFGSVKFYITVYERIGAAKAKTVDINTGEIQPWYSVHFFVDEPAAAVVDGDNNDLCLFYDDFIEYTTANPSCSASGCTPDIKAVMVQAVECVLPQNTLTGEIYLPCDAPAAFYQLQPGDVIKFKASPATCVTI